MDDARPPDAPSPHPTPDATGTSGESPTDPRVAAALDRLPSLDDVPVEEHPAVYAAVHGDLRDALADAAGRDITDPA